jgi:hypothetical protein
MLTNFYWKTKMKRNKGTIRRNLADANNSREDTIPWVWLDQTRSTEHVIGQGAVENCETNQMEISTTSDSNDALPTFIVNAKFIFLNGRYIHSELDRLMPRDQGQELTPTSPQEELITLDNIRPDGELKVSTYKCGSAGK